MKIKVRVETHYGKTLVYPICPKAILFTEIANTKTLTGHVLQAIKDLGYLIEVQQPETPREL